jgi:hypothetical protein
VNSVAEALTVNTPLDPFRLLLILVAIGLGQQQRDALDAK